ncbi:hypothetical protein J6590_001861 [Homalodisca vitripennis]|nr:hypothetical protein J6590_001861 [Homalodisca vitripennis]
MKQNRQDHVTTLSPNKNQTIDYRQYYSDYEVAASDRRDSGDSPRHSASAVHCRIIPRQHRAGQEAVDHMMMVSYGLEYAGAGLDWACQFTSVYAVFMIHCAPERSIRWYSASAVHCRIIPRQHRAGQEAVDHMMMVSYGLEYAGAGLDWACQFTSVYAVFMIHCPPERSIRWYSASAVHCRIILRQHRAGQEAVDHMMMVSYGLEYAGAGLDWACQFTSVYAVFMIHCPPERSIRRHSASAVHFRINPRQHKVVQEALDHIMMMSYGLEYGGAGLNLSVHLLVWCLRQANPPRAKDNLRTQFLFPNH